MNFRRESVSANSTEDRIQRGVESRSVRIVRCLEPGSIRELKLWRLAPRVTEIQCAVDAARCPVAFCQRASERRCVAALEISERIEGVGAELVVERSVVAPVLIEKRAELHAMRAAPGDSGNLIAEFRKPAL